jgi:signal transduction histidine kinase
MLQSILRRTGFVRQLTLIASIAMLGLSLCLSFMNSADMRHRLSAAYVEQTNCFIAGIAGVTLQDTTAAGELSERSRERLAASLRLPDFLRIEISDRNHRRMLLQEKPQAAELLGAMTAERPVPASPSRAQLLQENSEAWLFAAPIVGPSTAEGAGGAARPQVLGYVQLLASKATLNRSVRTLLLINLGISLSITVLMLLLLRWTVRRAMAPLHELSSLMQRAEHGDSSLRAEPLGSREIADMALAFNRMMEVLDERGLALRQSHEDAMHNARLTSRFATSVSHEVRTPLNGLVGMLDLLRETQLTKRQQECVDIAWSSSQALIELIDDILDFSKLEAGKLELEEIEFDLRQLVEDILTLLAKQAQQKNLALGYLMDAEVPDRISMA